MSEDSIEVSHIISESHNIIDHVEGIDKLLLRIEKLRGRFKDQPCKCYKVPDSPTFKCLRCIIIEEDDDLAK